jgi:hypothetical protein
MKDIRTDILLPESAYRSLKAIQNKLHVNQSEAIRESLKWLITQNNPQHCTSRFTTFYISVDLDKKIRAYAASKQYELNAVYTEAILMADQLGKVIDLIPQESPLVLKKINIPATVDIALTNIRKRCCTSQTTAIVAALYWLINQNDTTYCTSHRTSFAVDSALKRSIRAYAASKLKQFNYVYIEAIRNYAANLK